MTKVVCPGSFDPVTNGHLDIIGRVSQLFTDVIVAVGFNPGKSNKLFTPAERVAMLQAECVGFTNVTVTSFSGLLTEFCRNQQIDAIAKGLRGGVDLDYEMQMAQMNMALTGVQTVFLPTSPDYGFVSSSLIKEVAANGGDVASFVPATVLPILLDRLTATSSQTS